MPNRINLFAKPYHDYWNLDSDLAIYAQDKWTVSRDAMKYSFTLRDGLKFHDGEPFDAEGFKAIKEIVEEDVKHDGRVTHARYVSLIDAPVEQRVMVKNGLNDPWSNTIFFRMVLNWTTDGPATYSANYQITLSQTVP